jgi:beta-glucanase (GH16 family)
MKTTTIISSVALASALALGTSVVGAKVIRQLKLNPKTFPRDIGSFHMNNLQGDLNPPSSWNQNLPLADQNNSGNWTVNPDLTENFNTSSLDASKWLMKDPHTGGGVDVHNVVLTGSELDLLLTKIENPTSYHHYAGALIFSKKPALYGYFEAEIQCASDYANNNFFLYAIAPKERTEIDVFEIYPMPAGSAEVDAMNAHVFYSPTVSTHVSYQSRFLLGTPFKDGFHVFGLKWTPTELEWDLDGQTIRKGPNPAWHQPLNIDIGTFDSAKDDALDPSQLPATMRIKLVISWSQSS